MKKTLVVYHSRSGNTQRVAAVLAEMLDADLEEIATVRARRGLLGALACAIEALLGTTPALARSRHDPAHYERVLIGSPVWCWSLASPVQAWALRHALGAAKVGFFCTMDSSGATHAFQQLEELCGRPPTATLALSRSDLQGDIAPALDHFAARMRRRSGGTWRQGGAETGTPEPKQSLHVVR